MSNGEKYSYSKLACFEQCPYKYKLIYLDNHRVDNDTIATSFGTLIHHIEEEIGNCIKDKKPIDYPKLLNEFDTEVKEIETKYAKDFHSVDKSNRTYKDKATYYRDFGIYRLEKRCNDNPELEIINLEKEFYLEFDGYLFHGFIDRIFKYKDTYIIEDIKTYPKPILPNDLKIPLQHVIYSLALKSIGINNITCTYDLPLCNVTQTVDKDYFDKGVRKLVNIFDDIKYSDFKPTPTPLCHWCEFCPTMENQPDEAKGLCPYYCKWTKETKDRSVNYKWLGVKRHQQILEDFRKTLDLKN